MPTTLATPIVGPTVTNVAVVAFETRWTAGVLSEVRIVYVSSDGADNPTAGVQPSIAVTNDGPTMTAALTAFYQQGAHPKMGALAALAAINPALAGAVS